MSTVERALSGAAIEVTAKATRRRFTTDYKRKIVREADGCKTPGAVGALLRREGLYSSHLTTWRAAPRAWGSGRTDGREEEQPRAARPRSARQADRRGGASHHVPAETRRASRSPHPSAKKTSRRCWGRLRTPGAPHSHRYRGRAPTPHWADVPGAPG